MDPSHVSNFFESSTNPVLGPLEDASEHASEGYAASEEGTGNDKLQPLAGENEPEDDGEENIDEDKDEDEGEKSEGMMVGKIQKKTKTKGKGVARAAINKIRAGSSSASV
jgi:hypothetical protein